jgi:Cdc6-like AAA superfamily ATPase
MSALVEFPQELLLQPSQARLAYFQNKVVAHPHLKEAHGALLKAIQQPAGASLIFVFGPTGVGKTTLRLRVEQHLREAADAAAEHHPGQIPVIGVEAIAAERGDFKWKDFYSRALTALDEPLLAHKIDYGVCHIRRDSTGRLVVAPHVAASDLRGALEQALRQRQTAALIVDEAQHLKKIAGGRRLLDQMDVLKSLASLTGTIHVLVGTYELLGLADLSAQLNRRSYDIHFPRYRPDDAQDMLAFQSVLLTFQRHLPLSREPDLVGRIEYFYEQSVGCVGVLKNWLTRALRVALEDQAETLTSHHLEACAEPVRKLLRLAREIKEGEETLQERATQRDELRLLLSMPTQSALPLPAKSKGRAVERKPHRDPVGRENLVR